MEILYVEFVFHLVSGLKVLGLTGRMILLGFLGLLELVYKR